METISTIILLGCIAYGLIGLSDAFGEWLKK